MAWKPLIISFHTPDRLYTYCSDRLKRSLERFDIEHHVVKQESMGGWRENCLEKSRFILLNLMAFPDRDMVWLDSDAEVFKYPDLFETLTSDVACTINAQNVCLASTIFFKNGELSRNFVTSWMKFDQKYRHHETADQPNFDAMVKRMTEEGKITWDRLPDCYAFEDGITKPCGGEPVIMQWIASRIGKQLEELRMNGELRGNIGV